MKRKLSFLCAKARQFAAAFAGNNCAMHAAGLTYYSMLSLVPVLCILLLVAKSLGAGDLARDKVHEQVETMISKLEKAPDDTLAALTAADEAALEEKRRVAQEFAEQARSLERQVFDSVDRIDMGTIGWAGFAMLVWTVLSSIGTIEATFNRIWGVGKGRPLWRKMLLNALVLVAMPLLGGLALSAPVFKIAKDAIAATAGATSVTRWLSDGAIWLLDSWPARFAVTLAFSSLAFAFLFSVLPYRRTSWSKAWRCGLVTAAAFGAWLKICTVAQVGIAKSSALYGSLAFLPIMLAWLYTSWQIVLAGCCLHKVSETPPDAA